MPLQEVGPVDGGVATTSTSTSPSAGTGSRTSFHASRSGPPGSVIAMACMGSDRIRLLAA